MPTLRELLSEMKRRRDAAQAEPAPATATHEPDRPAPPEAPATRTPAFPLSSTSSEAPAEAWLAERSVKREFGPGEWANILVGLTPSGKDKQGRQVTLPDDGVDLGDTRATLISSSRPKRIS